jgi:hypothetical protein
MRWRSGSDEMVARSDGIGPVSISVVIRGIFSLLAQ